MSEQVTLDAAALRGLVEFCKLPEIVAATDGAFDPDAYVQSAGKALQARASADSDGKCNEAEPESAGVPEGWKLDRISEDEISVYNEGTGCLIARKRNDASVHSIFLFALCEDLLSEHPAQGREGEQ